MVEMISLACEVETRLVIVDVLSSDACITLVELVDWSVMNITELDAVPCAFVRALIEVEGDGDVNPSSTLELWILVLAADFVELEGCTLETPENPNTVLNPTDDVVELSVNVEVIGVTGGLGVDLDLAATLALPLLNGVPVSVPVPVLDNRAVDVPCAVSVIELLTNRIVAPILAPLLVVSTIPPLKIVADVVGLTAVSRTVVVIVLVDVGLKLIVCADPSTDLKVSTNWPI